MAKAELIEKMAKDAKVSKVAAGASVSTVISVLLTQPTCDYWLKILQKRIG